MPDVGCQMSDVGCQISDLHVERQERRLVMIGYDLLRWSPKD